MLTHVLENAVKFSANGGLIEVSLDVTPSEAQTATDETTDSGDVSPTEHNTLPVSSTPAAFLIRVSDQGVGVPEGDLEAIFAPFRRVDTSLTRETSGLGIGLALCRHIVEAHGGAIWVERAPDMGSVFSIRLPRLDYRLGYPLVER